MTHEQCTAKLAAYYKEPMREIVSLDEAGHQKTIPNLRVKENHAWMIRNIHADSLDRFYNNVIANFKPTSTVPYPLVSDLEYISRSGYVPERIGKDDNLTMENMMIEYQKVNEIPKDASPPKGITIGEIYDEVKKHDADNNHIINKYGINGALKAWALFREINNGTQIQREMLFDNWKYYLDERRSGC
jgi:hypothetical protein